MKFVKAALLILAGMLVLSDANAQNRQYHIYSDTDNNPSTGCDVNWPSLGGSVSGVDARYTVTTDSQLPPNIIDNQIHQCQGGTFGSGQTAGQAALGLNGGFNGGDVVEVGFNTSHLGINTSGNVLFYFATESTAASDVVLTGNNGGPIFLGFAFPVPALGLLGLVLMAGLILWVSRKQLSIRLKSSMIMLMVVGTAWAMTIIVDGQTSDWNAASPVANDPVGDTDGTGSYADIVAIYQTKNDNELFFRIDVVDIENQAPVANDTSDSTLEEQMVTITLTGSDPEGAALTFAQSNPPSNGTLSNFQVVNNTTSTVDYTPNTDFAGIDSFSVVANDGQVDSAPATVTVTVDPVNDAPSFTSGGDVNVLKTAGPYNQSWASNISAGPANESGQTLTFNITNNDNAAIFTQQPSIDSAGVLTFTGANNATGTANITVVLSDDGGTANGGVDSATPVAFSITLQGVNDPPSFTGGADETILEDAGAQTVPNWATNISPGPADEAGQNVTFNVTSNTNAALFSSGPAIAPDGTLTYTTAADANGTAMITIELMDDGGTANGGDDTSPPQSFNITVTAVNDAPSFTAGVNQSVLEGAGAQMVNNWATAISPGPSDESGQNVSFNVSNDNNALFAVQPAIDANGNLTYTPSSGTGSATVTVSISDDGGTANGGIDTSADQTFMISVTQVNDPPSFTGGADETILEDAGAQTVVSWATNISPGPADEAGQNVTFNVIGNTNAALFSAGPAIAPDGTLTYTTTADANGSAMITIELMDDGGTANGGVDTSPPQSFNITVTPVNDAPTFVAGGAQSVLEDVGAQIVNGWVTGITPGPSDESGQNVTFTVTNDNNALFSVQPAVDAAGNLSYTPAPNASGSANVSVTAVDDGGTANGGIDTSATQMVVIDVVGINDAPSFNTAGDPAASDEDAGTQSLSWASAILAGPPDESGQNLTFNLTQTAIDPTLSFSSAPSIDSTSGNVEFTAAPNSFGTASYDVVLMDDGGTANGGVDVTAPAVSMTITVNPVNDPPTVSPPGPFAVTPHISINVADGANDLLAGATDVETGTTLTIQGTGTINSTNGGTVTVDNNTGAFTYQPPAGFTGADTFQYQVCDDGIPLPAACSTAATVTLNVSGNVVWFIDGTAAAGGDGTLDSPFATLTEFNNDTLPGDGDFVYLSEGTYNEAGITLGNNQTLFGQGTTGTFDAIAGITPPANSSPRPTLNGNRPVIASSADGINMFSNNTIRGVNVADTVGYALQGQAIGNLTVNEVSVTGMGGAIEVTTSGTFVSVAFDQLDANSNSSMGINLHNITGSMTVTNPGAGITSGSASPAVRVNGGNVSFTYAGNINNTLSRSVDILNKTGGTITFSGNITDSAFGIWLTNNTGATTHFTGNMALNTGLNPGFTATGGGTVSATGVNNTITTSSGMAVNMQNVVIDAAGFSLNQVNANGATTGMVLDTVTGPGMFRVTGSGNTAGSGGTIQNNSISGFTALNTSNIEIRNMNFINSANESPGCLADVVGVTGVCHAAIELMSANNVSLINSTIDGNGDASDELGIFAQNVSNFDMDGVTVQNVSDAVNEHGIYVVNLTGTGAQESRWQNLTVNNTVGDTSVLVVQNNGTGSLLIDGDSTLNGASEGGFEARTVGPGANLTVTIGDASPVGSGSTVLIENTNTGGLFVASQGTLVANVRNSVIQPGGGTMFVALSGQSDAAGNVTMNTTGNLITQDDGGNGGTGRAVAAIGGSGRAGGDVDNNVMDSDDEFVNGMFSNFAGTGTINDNIINMDGNTINMVGSGGNETIVGIQYRASNSAGGLTMNITNNTIDSAGDNTFSGGIVALSGNSSGTHNNTLCNDIVGNDVSAPMAAAGADDYIFATFTGTDHQLENIQLGALTEAHIDNHITNNDSGITTATDVIVYSSGGSYTGVSGCPQ